MNLFIVIAVSLGIFALIFFGGGFIVTNSKSIKIESAKFWLRILCMLAFALIGAFVLFLSPFLLANWIITGWAFVIIATVTGILILLLLISAIIASRE